VGFLPSACASGVQEPPQRTETAPNAEGKTNPRIETEPKAENKANPVQQASELNHAVIEATVDHGFSREFGSGFTFWLKGQDVYAWTIEITHESAPDKDLIYPVDPPYRLSNHRYIGPGYGESTRDSVRNTPRNFAFIYRLDDIGKAWDNLEKILWPYTFTEAEVQHAMNEVFPTGNLKFEILSADFIPGPARPDGGPPQDIIASLKFRATITWPRS
jgi:hypothetical protein